LTDPELNFTICKGMSDAEFEDLLSPEFYANLFKNTYGVAIDSAKFKSSKKWSDRMAEAFRTQGKQWNDSVKAEVKLKVAQLVSTSPDGCLLAARRGALDALIATIEGRLAEEKHPAAPSRRGAA